MVVITMSHRYHEESISEQDHAYKWTQEELYSLTSFILLLVRAMPHEKQFTLYSHGLGPNGWKVVFVLEELGLSYETKYLKFDKLEHKSLEHTKYNPNGRIPTLIDHWNNDFTIWESNAIMVYLVEKYDKNYKISVSDFNEKMAQLQWLFFQSSGQGPYFGQAGWFRLFHPEKIPSAIERYQKEIIRVLGVLESVLSKQEWLVGGKCTIADLSFVTWNHVAVTRLAVDYNEFDFEKDFPAVHRWHSAMCSRESVCNALSLRDSLAASGQ